MFQLNSIFTNKIELNWIHTILSRNYFSLMSNVARASLRHLRKSSRKRSRRFPPHVCHRCKPKLCIASLQKQRKTKVSTTKNWTKIFNPYVCERPGGRGFRADREISFRPLRLLQATVRTGNKTSILGSSYQWQPLCLKTTQVPSQCYHAVFCKKKNNKII